MLIYGVFFAAMAVIADGLSRIWRRTKDGAAKLLERTVSGVAAIPHKLMSSSLFHFVFKMML